MECQQTISSQGLIRIPYALKVPVITLFLLLFLLLPLHNSKLAAKEQHTTAKYQKESAQAEEPNTRKRSLYVNNGKELVILWWNVENLFDTVDDPGVDDREFTPGGRKGWTEKKLELKLLRLGHVVRLAREEVGDYPALLAFAEVENEGVFGRLLSGLPEANYEAAYHESPDGRGIDIAVAYDRSRLTLVGDVHRGVLFEGRPTRDVSAYGFEVQGTEETLWLVVNHWPSRSMGRKWSEPKRIAAAKVTRELVDHLRGVEWSRGRRANIVVAGDFNDEPDDRSVKKVLGADGSRKKVVRSCGKRLYNCWRDLEKDEDELGSYNYRGKWNRLDQVLVSCGLLDGVGLEVPEDGFRCFQPGVMRKGRQGVPWATYERGKFRGGYSDHFPLLLSVDML